MTDDALQTPTWDPSQYQRSPCNTIPPTFRDLVFEPPSTNFLKIEKKKAFLPSMRHLPPCPPNSKTLNHFCPSTQQIPKYIRPQLTLSPQLPFLYTTKTARKSPYPTAGSPHSQSTSLHSQAHTVHTRFSVPLAYSPLLYHR